MSLDDAERGFADGLDEAIEPDIEGEEDLIDPLDPSRTPLTRPNATGEIIRDQRNRGGSTLDEPVIDTLLRDIKAVGFKIGQVLWPRAGGESLRDWDLWGPLVFCLFLALFLSITSPDQQATIVFSGVFALVWFGEAVVTVSLGEALFVNDS